MLKLSLSCCWRESTRFPKQHGCPRNLEYQTPIANTTHFAYRTGGIQLDLTRKVPPWKLALILLKGGMQAATGEKESIHSYDAYVPQWPP